MIELNKIYNEDCSETIKRMEDKSVDLVLTDMPYGITACKWDKVPDLEVLWKEFKRIGKDNCAYVFTASQPFTTDLINSNRKWFKYEWIWEKTKPSNFQIAKYNPLKYHENILIFYNNKPIYNQYNLKPCFIKSGRKNKGANLKQLKYSDKNWITKETGFNHSIIKISNPSGKGHLHPTQKPVALFEYLIKIYTNEGDLVYDGFMGSGTSAIAAINLKRNWIGSEISPEYCKIANKRIKDLPTKLL